VLSAGFGAWLAYDQGAAWRKFLFIVGGVAVYYAIILVPEQVRLADRRQFAPLRLLLLLLPAVIAAYFLATHDWLAEPRGSAWLGSLKGWLAAIQIDVPGLQLQANQAGGMIAAFLPLQIAAIASIKDARIGILVAVPLLGLSALGLALSAARGAWLVLVVVGLIWLVGRRTVVSSHPSRQVRQTGRWQAMGMLITLAVVLVTFWALLATPAGAWLQGSDSGRLSLWRNSLALAGDYPFTGLGLASFEMAYSSYAMLLHVPFLSHAHNLFLDVWLEQGMLGVVSLVWLLIVALRWQPTASYWQPAALASVAVILLHGLLDDSFYGYGGAGMLLILIPFALLVKPTGPQAPASWPVAVARPVRRLWRFLVALVLALAVLGVLIVPRWQATWQANMGALAQTRTELSIYRWPNYPIQDAVRQEPAALAAAVARFQAALARNPANATANRRLGQIELSQGRYEEARRHLATAYAAAPEQRATRQLLGESYAVSGNVDEAAALWQTVDVTLGQLGLREGWYELIGDPTRAAWIAQAVRAMRTAQ
jgi:tetratricopeptide (TPR) repeat protein